MKKYSHQYKLFFDVLSLPNMSTLKRFQEAVSRHMNLVFQLIYAIASEKTYFLKFKTLAN